jgi:hypothetical protein
MREEENTMSKAKERLIGPETIVTITCGSYTYGSGEPVRHGDFHVSAGDYLAGKVWCPKCRNERRESSGVEDRSAMRPFGEWLKP